MLISMWRPRKSIDPSAKAAQIIAKAAAKKLGNSGLFTELQEEKRRQLGLHPTLRPDGKKEQAEERKDPLTKRQRAMMKELGLTKQRDQEA